VAELVTNEFFEQGDIERRKFNITPIVSKIGSFILFKTYFVIIILKCNFVVYIGHNESRKRRSITNDASRIHRLDLFTHISGELNLTVFTCTFQFQN